MSVPYWFPVGLHRAAGPARPWFVTRPDGFVFLGAGHPDGPSSEPWFCVRDALVYPTPQHPDGESGVAWFELVGSFAYAAVAHPEFPAPGPLYQLRAFD